MEKYASNNSSNNEAIAQDKLDDAQDKLEKKDNRRERSVQCLYGNGRQNWWQEFVWALYVPTCRVKLIKEVTPGLSIMTNNDSVLSFCVSVNLIVSNLPMLLWL